MMNTSEGLLTGYLDYHPGDVVCLKSGGPRMTVWAMEGLGLVRTAWFAGDILRRDAFHADELVCALADNPRIQAEFEGMALPS